tara:strand:- start:3461 stop:4951 length:1491 start_codon:yes stop_codon:yes gene_type:complete
MNFNEWLEAKGLTKYADIFAAHEIDEVEILASLSDAELESIGVPLGARKKILRELSPHLLTPLPGTPIPSPPVAPDPNVDGTSPESEPASIDPDPVSQTEATQIPHQVDPEHPGHASPIPVHDTNAFAQSPAPQPPEPAYQEQPVAFSAAPAIAPVSQKNAPDSRNGSKATAILIAVGVHAAIALVAALLVILPPTKDEPEIVASIVAPAPTAQQEMKKKTVQKQVKRNPASASSAAAPMAMMMKANTTAAFSVPNVTRTSTGPLGMGDGDLGSGAMGMGTGLDGAGAGSFMGMSTTGQLAVVFDVTRSMYGSVPFVIEEIERSFRTAQVMVVFSGGFEQRPLTSIVPYKSNDKVQLLVEINAKTAKTGASQSIAQAKRMNRSLFKVVRCDSIESNHKLTRSSTNLGGGFQSLGTALELLVNQTTYPKTIFVFSDFSDATNPGYMRKVQNLCRSKNVKVVFWCPFANPSANFKKALSQYKTFANAVGGEVKIEPLK